MAKDKTTFLCSNCGRAEPKWAGRCPDCGEWNTFVETKPSSPGSSRSPHKTESVPLSAIQLDAGSRISSRIEEVDRVLGGGLMKGSSVLVGGEPGIGKSTLMLQVAADFDTNGRILYITGEETPGQIRMRAERLGVENSSLEVLCETDLASITASLNALKPVVTIVDSIQTLISPELGSIPGTVNQIKYGCHEIISWTRDRRSSVFLVAHVTKEGTIAGPKVIEHLVDTVLYFEQPDSELRILRATKNRFGSVDEIGLFTMSGTGLVQVRNPSSVFMVHRDGELPPGVVVAPVFEGSRVLLVEIQALVVPAKSGVSRTFSDRIDAGRVSRTAAVLEKHLPLRFSDQDIYVNVAGGIRINEVGIELPLALALYSARTSIPVPAKTAAAGEITLAGELRPIPHMSRRVRTARELDFINIIGPKPNAQDEQEQWAKYATIKESIGKVFANE